MAVERQENAQVEEGFSALRRKGMPVPGKGLKGGESLNVAS